MIEFVRWAITLEIVGLAFLPLTLWGLKALPDRGYAFARVLGLLGITYVTWLAGQVLPVGATPILPLFVLVAVGAAGWVAWGRSTLATLKEIRLLVGIEEVLFLGGLLVWSLLRVYVIHPDIAHTEQFMDMALLNASYHSTTYPPFDPWMSGHSINYYYFGYLIFGTLCRISGVAPAVGYNLALSTLAGLTLSGAYSLGFGLARRSLWALLAPLFLAVIGNWHAVLVQLPNNHLPGNSTWWFWDSTRVVGSAGDYTINEFPFFSFLLGDLHPHVMALPVTLLAIALACGLAFGEEAVEWNPASLGRLALIALCVGSLFTINSWDFPTYLLIVALCLGAVAYITTPSSGWWQKPLAAAIALGILSVALFAPFYLRFKSLAHGIGTVSTRTDIWQFLQVFGLFLFGCLLLVSTLAVLLQPAEESAEEAEDEPLPRAGVLGGETGQVRLDSGALSLLITLAVVAVIAAFFDAWVLALVVALGGGAAMVLHRVLNTEQPDRGDVAALILVIVACGVLAFTEVGYLRDSFDGSSMYRMNTVFKFYYQAWALLALSAAYGVYRSWGILRRLMHPAVAWGALALVAAGTAAGGAYTVYALQSPVQDSGIRSLDGAAWLRTESAGDYAAVQWLLAHVHDTPVELEATGGEYTHYARISTFAGIPTVLGWAGHEGQWRGADPEIGRRTANIHTIYTTPDVPMAKRLLREYDVRYVIVGDKERASFPNNQAGFAKFARFMKPVFQAPGMTVYGW